MGQTDRHFGLQLHTAPRIQWIGIKMRGTVLLGEPELTLQHSCTLVSGACCLQPWGEASFPRAGLSARVCLFPFSLLFLPLCQCLSSSYCAPSINRTLLVRPPSPSFASWKQNIFNKCQWVENRERAGEKTKAVAYKTFTQQYKKSNY